MPKNLLLADDSKTIQTAVSMTFAREDVRLITVDDGEAALQKAREERPDLILADVTMPKLSGYELCQRLRSDAALKDVPVLLLGGGAPVDPAKAMAVGANGHMPKPFDSTKLIDQVKQILANPRAPMTAAPVAPAPSAPPSRPPAAAPAFKPPPPAQRPSVPAPARPAAPGSSIAPPRPPASPAAARPSAPPAGARPPMPARPPGAPSSPPGTPVPGVRPPVARPPGAPAPGTRPPPPGAAKPPPPGTRPVTQPTLRAGTPPPLAKPPAASARPPPPPAARPQPPRPPPAPVLADDEDIPMDEEMDEAPTPLRAVSTGASTKPSLSVVPPPDGGEAVLRDALSKASREVIEKIAWEVVPELAETIIREELERLLKERGA